MQIIESMEDKEVKMKRTRRGKRCGRRNRRELNFGDDEIAEDIFGPYHANKDLKSVKWRKFYVRPRYSPTAPHNSTQFIMEDQHHCLNYCENLAELSGMDEMSMTMYPTCHGDLSKQSDYGSPFSDYGSPNSDMESIEFKNLEIDSSVFMANDFESFYNQVRTEELSKLSKDELIEEIVCMEDKVYNLERKTSASSRNGQTVRSSSTKVSRNVKSKAHRQNSVSRLHEELELLKKENQKLKQEKTSVSPS